MTAGDVRPNDERALRAALADVAAVIEQAAADLALAEEPARFVAALEGEGREPAPGGPEGARD